jgi:hypothetical protein
MDMQNSAGAPGTSARSRSGRTAVRPATAGVVRLLVAASVLTLTVGAGPVAAHGTTVPCASRTETKAFQNWGDSSLYFLVPNGGFESGTTDWQVSGGSAIVSDNETWKVAGSNHTKALRIPPGATAESRTICVGAGEDYIRMFVKDPGVNGAILHIEAVVRGTNGSVGVQAFDMNSQTASKGKWTVTPRHGLPNLLGPTGTQTLTFVFTTRGTSATWQIDDVYVDPLKSY